MYICIKAVISNPFGGQKSLWEFNDGYKTAQKIPSYHLRKPGFNVYLLTKKTTCSQSDSLVHWHHVFFSTCIHSVPSEQAVRTEYCFQSFRNQTKYYLIPNLPRPFQSRELTVQFTYHSYLSFSNHSSKIPSLPQAKNSWVTLYIIVLYY